MSTKIMKIIFSENAKFHIKFTKNKNHISLKMLLFIIRNNFQALNRTILHFRHRNSSSIWCTWNSSSLFGRWAPWWRLALWCKRHPTTRWSGRWRHEITATHHRWYHTWWWYQWSKLISAIVNFTGKQAFRNKNKTKLKNVSTLPKKHP